MAGNQSHWKRNIYNLLAGEAVSLITSGILQMAILFSLADRTGSAMVLSLATLAGLWASSLCYLVMGASGPLDGVSCVLNQERIKPEFPGRVFWLPMSLMSLAMPLGLLFSGALARKLGINPWFMFSGLAKLAYAHLTWRHPAIRVIDAQKAAPEGRQTN